MRLMRLVIFSVVIFTATCGKLTLAQHNHGHVRPPVHHGHVQTSVHHGTYYGHHDWNYVVPHHSTYGGAYYSTGDTHYYTPAHVVPIAPSLHEAQIQSTPVTVQKPVAMRFDGFSRYQDLAGRLDVAANLLCLDMHYNHRHHPRFAEIYREAYEILQAARFIHGKEHQGDQETIRRRMAEVDRLFHHVQGEIAGWTSAQVKPIGSDPLQGKAAFLEAILHHLCFDVGVKPHEQPQEAAPTPQVEDAPPPQNEI